MYSPEQAMGYCTRPQYIDMNDTTIDGGEL